MKICLGLYGTYRLATFDSPACARPTLFTLGITLLRLAGELRGWPSPWFDKSGGVVGITWFLPPIFGFYFAWKLWREGQRIDRVNRAFALALLGVVLNQWWRQRSLSTRTSAADFVDSGDR